MGDRGVGIHTFKLTGSPNRLGFFIAASLSEPFFAPASVDLFCFCSDFLDVSVGDIFSAEMEIGSPRRVGFVDWADCLRGWYLEEEELVSRWFFWRGGDGAVVEDREGTGTDFGSHDRHVK